MSSNKQRLRSRLTFQNPLHMQEVHQSANQSIELHGRRFLDLLLRPSGRGTGNRLRGTTPRCASSPASLPPAALPTTEEHAAHHVEQRVAALPRDLDAEPDLADLRQCVAPQALDVLQVRRVVFRQLLEERRVTLLGREHEQCEEVEERD